MRYAVVEILPVCGDLPNGVPRKAYFTTKNIRAVKLNGRLPRRPGRILY
jgi:hypothetical protein